MERPSDVPLPSVLDTYFIFFDGSCGDQKQVRALDIFHDKAVSLSWVPVCICGESMVSPCSVVSPFPQCKPTPESATRCCALDLEGRPVRPSPPPSAVAGPTVVVRKNGRPLPISDVYYIKPMLLPHEGWPMAVGNCSRPRGSAPSRKNRTAV